jgi:hypothetical protein
MHDNKELPEQERHRQRRGHRDRGVAIGYSEDNQHIVESGATENIGANSVASIANQIAAGGEIRVGDIQNAFMQGAVHDTQRATRARNDLERLWPHGVNGLPGGQRRVQLTAQAHNAQEALTRYEHSLERITRNRIRYRWEVLIARAGELERLADLQRALTVFVAGRQLRLSGYRAPREHSISWSGFVQRAWDHRDVLIERISNVIGAVNNLLELLIFLCRNPAVPAAFAGPAAVIVAQQAFGGTSSEGIEYFPEAPTEAPPIKLLE